MQRKLLYLGQISGNALTLLITVLYYQFPRPFLGWTAGICILFTLLLTAGIQYGRLGPDQNLRGKFGVYLYLCIVNVLLWAIFLGNFVGFEGATVADNRPIYVLTYGSLYLLFLAGIILGIRLWLLEKHAISPIEFAKQNESNVIDSQQSPILCMVPLLPKKIRSFLKFALKLACYLGLLMGVLIAYTFIRGVWLLGFIIGIFAGMACIFFGLTILNGLITLLRLRGPSANAKHPVRHRRVSVAIGIIGIISVGMCFLPFLSAPVYISDAKKSFDTTFNPIFGGNWENSIAAADEPYLLPSPFNLGAYFIMDDPNCIMIKDELYFNGSRSLYAVDSAITLYFDAYLPPNRGLRSDGTPLPGCNSTIIRIHGGSWVLGDKASGNVLMMNKYFAQQGYCVFDIQYGMNNKSGNTLPIITPDNVLANVTIDDIMRHVGNFTQYLIAHAPEFGANISSVFVSGGSAGGQLTCATALGIASGNYTPIFGNGITIRGMLPYYPANRANTSFVVIGLPEWHNPELLVNSNSPPCLLYQGSQDPLIARTRSLIDTYINHDNPACTAIYFPFAGHASDIYFPGPFNQVFLYYMERFLLMYR